MNSRVARPETSVVPCLSASAAAGMWRRAEQPLDLAPGHPHPHRGQEPLTPAPRIVKESSAPYEPEQNPAGYGLFCAHGHAQRKNSHTPDQKRLTAKRSCDGHPALCAVIWFGDFIADSLLWDAQADEPTSKESGERTNADKYTNDDCLNQQLKHTRSSGRFGESQDHDSNAAQQTCDRSSKGKSFLHDVSGKHAEL